MLIMQGLKKLCSTGRKGNGKKIGPSPSSPFLLHLTERDFIPLLANTGEKKWPPRVWYLTWKGFFLRFFNSLSHMQVCNILRRKLAIDGKGGGGRGGGENFPYVTTKELLQTGVIYGPPIFETGGWGFVQIKAISLCQRCISHPQPTFLKNLWCFSLVGSNKSYSNWRNIYKIFVHIMFEFREQYKVPTYYLLLLFLRLCIVFFFLPAGHQIKKTGENHIADSCGEERGGGKAGLLLLLHFPSLHKRGRGDLHRRDL